MKRTNSRENSPKRVESPERKRIRIEKLNSDNNSLGRMIEATATSGEGRIAKTGGCLNFLGTLTEDGVNSIFKFMSADGSIMAYACASTDCNKAVHDFCVQLIVYCKNIASRLFPFNNMYNVLSPYVDMNTSVHSYICSRNFLLKNSPPDTRHNILSEFNELFEKSFQRNLEPWVAGENWYLLEFFESPVEVSEFPLEGNLLPVHKKTILYASYNDSSFALNFETVSSRFMSLKFINNYLSSRQILESIKIVNYQQEEFDKIIELAKLAKKHQPEEAYSEVIKTLIENSYESFSRTKDMNSFAIIAVLSENELLDEGNFELIQEVLISVLQHNNWSEFIIVSMYLFEIKNKKIGLKENKNSSFNQTYFDRLTPYLFRILKEDINRQNPDINEKNRSKVKMMTKDATASIMIYMMEHSKNPCFNYEEYREIIRMLIQCISEASVMQYEYYTFSKTLQKVIENKLSKIEDAGLRTLKLLLTQELTEAKSDTSLNSIIHLLKFSIKTKLLEFNASEFNQIKTDLIDIIATKSNSYPNLISKISSIITFLAEKELIEISTVDFYNLLDPMSAVSTITTSFRLSRWNIMELIKDLIDKKTIEMSTSMKSDLIQLATKAIEEDNTESCKNRGIEILNSLEKLFDGIQ